MPKHLQPKEKTKELEEHDYGRYWSSAISRLDSMAYDEVMFYPRVKEEDPTLYNRLEKGMEIIDIAWRDGNWEMFKRSVDLWEGLYRDWINKKIKGEEHVL